MSLSTFARRIYNYIHEFLSHVLLIVRKSSESKYSLILLALTTIHSSSGRMEQAICIASLWCFNNLLQRTHLADTQKISDDCIIDVLNIQEILCFPEDLSRFTYILLMVNSLFLANNITSYKKY